MVTIAPTLAGIVATARPVISATTLSSDATSDVIAGLLTLAEVRVTTEALDDAGTCICQPLVGVANGLVGIAAGGCIDPNDTLLIGDVVPPEVVDEVFTLGSEERIGVPRPPVGVGADGVAAGATGVFGGNAVVGVPVVVGGNVEVAAGALAAGVTICGEETVWPPEERIGFPRVG